MDIGEIKDVFLEYGFPSLFMFISLLLLSLFLLSYPLFQKTLYIPANDFTLKGVYHPAIAFYNYSNSVNAMFYGEQQPNGTGCIDEVVINSTKIITNSSQVENEYYNFTNFESSNGLYVNIPFGSTLLCSSIINSSS